MANNRVQVKRTSTAGRTPNTTGSYATNSQYISAGELALNMTDGILYSSDGTNLITVGSNLVNQNISNVLTVKAISANGGNGSSGQVLTSNGTATYWSTVSSGPGGSVNTNESYVWTNTHNFNSNTTVGNATFANTFLNSYTGISNPQSLTAGVLQTSATLNTLIVGPYTISSGNSLIITTGSRVVII